MVIQCSTGLLVVDMLRSLAMELMEGSGGFMEELSDLRKMIDMILGTVGRPPFPETSKQTSSHLKHLTVRRCSEVEANFLLS